ncbi:MAG: NUDIX domain-containing protein [bacterium]|nr:NUDIX domain-containing protein [bacterium]
MKKTVSAGIIIFRRTEDGLKYLLLYAGRGYWNFPKGKIEKAERSWETALREIKEETGLRPSELKFRQNFKAFEKFIFQHEKEKIFRVVILYLAETTQARITISAEEHEGFGWFTFGEAQKVLTKHKDTMEILRRAHRFIAGENKERRHAPQAPMPAIIMGGEEKQ